MPRIEFSNIGTTPFQKLLGHNKLILDNWEKTAETLFQQGKLSSDLKEQIRRSLAYKNECSY
jgi:calcineurin-like phosphoesterase family protein